MMNICDYCSQVIPCGIAMMDLHWQNECQLLWKNDVDQPKNIDEERDIIKKIMREDKMKRGNTYYVISFKWWQLWCEYVGYSFDENDNSHTSSDRKGLCTPSQIDNSSLIKSTSKDAENNFQELREDLQRGYDYEILPRKVWMRLIKWYGGGPEIPKKVILQSACDSRSLGVDIYPINVIVKYGPFSSIKYSFSRYQTIIDIKYVITNDLYVRPNDCDLYVANKSSTIKMVKEHNKKTLAEMHIQSGFTFIVHRITNIFPLVFKENNSHESS